MTQTTTTWVEDVEITCPSCEARKVRMSANWCIKSHHIGVDGSGPVPIWDKRACRSVTLNPNEVFRKFIERDIFAGELVSR